MKGKFTIIASVMALGAVGTTMWALSLPSGEVLKPTLLEHRTMARRSSQNAGVMKSATDGSMYWSVAKSCYKDGSLDLEEGDIRQFGTRVEIDGDEATIYGLVDLYFDEVDKEYAVKGKYNDRTGTITIEGTQYDSDKPASSFIKLADMYSLTNNEAYSVVLFAGDMTSETLETVDKLVFNVSEDLSTITSKTGYGAYAFSASGNPMAFYDYYQPGVTITESTADSGMALSADKLTFSGLFIATGMPVKETLYVYNKSTEEVSFDIETSSPEIEVSVKGGTIAPCSSRAVEVTLTPDQAGMFSGSVTVNSSVLAEPLKSLIEVEVWERPDYAKITKAGSAAINFDMSPVYPFVISEFDGHVVAKSTNNGKGSNTQSYFVCLLEVPEGQTGVFSWDAAQITSQPNTMTIYLDGEPIKYDYYVDTSEPVDMSGVVALATGKHEVAFSQNITLDWTEYGKGSEGYVWGLDFQLMDTQAKLAYLVDESADFGLNYYDGLSVEKKSEVTLLNVGTEALKVLEVKTDGNFSGIVPAVSVPQGGEITVPLIWAANALGADEGEVVIVTTAGEFSVKCKGMAEKLPYDYSKFVTEGEIAFNTDVEWPFVISDNGKYLYNSTSKTDIDFPAESWIEAIFDVPDGKVGEVSWYAINDSEKLFEFMGIPSLISGTRFTIDGGLEVMVGGEGVECASADVYSPEQLTFKPGRHNVRFTYRKTGNSEDYVFGDDRLKLFEIALKLTDVNEHKADISATEITYPKDVFVGCAGHYPVTVFNYTAEVPELISSTCNAPFTAKVVNKDGNNLNLMIEFKPEEAGKYAGELTLSTNLGDFILSCNGSAENSDLGTALYYESFEYDFLSDWTILDANGDDHSWTRLSEYMEGYSNRDLKPYDGAEGLIITGYDPTDYQDYVTDDYASTSEIAIPEDGQTTLRFMATSFSYMDQPLEILVGDGDDVAKYEVVETFVFDTPTSWTAYTVDLSQFAGKKVRIAFRGSETAFFIAIDDVLVATTGTNGMADVADGNAIVAEEYYSLAGERLSHPVKGVNVVVTRYSDGSRVSTKRVVK